MMKGAPDHESALLKAGRRFLDALKDPVQIQKTREYFERCPDAKEKFQRDLWALQLLLEKLEPGAKVPPVDVDALLS